MHKTEIAALLKAASESREHSPTAQAYGELHAAYEVFNVLLFDGALPPCLITLQRKSHRVYGYFSNSRFRSNRRSDLTTDEIAMNPMHFQGQNLTEVLQTVAHEMCHLWQHHFGKPSRKGYHNREWAEKMLSIGLHPSSTGEPGGAIVGQHMSDYLIPGGALAAAIDTLIENGFGISWYDRVADFLTYPASPNGAVTPAGIIRGRPGERTKYSCGGCKVNAWAKRGAAFNCAKCDLPMLPQFNPRIVGGDGVPRGKQARAME